MKKIILYILATVILVGGYAAYQSAAKILPFYEQLTSERVGTEIDLQNLEQKKASFVGSSKCLKCHEEKHGQWSHSGHPKMIQDFRKNP